MKYLFLTLIVVCTFRGFNQTEPHRIKMTVFDSILQSFELTGSILVYDDQNSTWYSNDFEWADQGHLPASTFKIPNTIISLETGVMASDSTIIKWDGKPRRLKAWEQDLKLKDAFRVSCVPCYQEIARRIGTKRMRQYLDKIKYPGIVFDSATIDKFWLEGNSKISQIQQIDFLRRFYFSELPITERTYTIMKTIMLVENNGNYKLSGKTGWGIRDGNDNGWYVGYLEKENNVFFFATNVVPKQGFDLDTFTTVRIEVTKSVLKRMGLM